MYINIQLQGGTNVFLFNKVKDCATANTKSTIIFKSSNNTMTFLMHAFVVRRQLAPAFILRSVQLKLKSWRNNSKSYQLNSLWVMPTTYLWAIVSLLLHGQKQQNSQFAMETICVEQRSNTQEEKNTGDFLHDGAVAAARKSCVLDSHPKTNREHKSPQPRRGCLHELGVLRAPLWRSTAWSGQLSPKVPWHFQTNASANQAFSSLLIHSSAAALRSRKKEQICFWWQPSSTQPLLKHHLNKKNLSLYRCLIIAPLLITDSFPQGDTTWLKRGETRKSLGSSKGANEDTVILLSDWQWCQISPVCEVISMGQHASPDPPSKPCFHAE